MNNALLIHYNFITSITALEMKVIKNKYFPPLSKSRSYLPEEFLAIHSLVIHVKDLFKAAVSDSGPRRGVGGRAAARRYCGGPGGPGVFGGGP